MQKPETIKIYLESWIQDCFIDPVEEYLEREIDERDLADIISYAIGYVGLNNNDGKLEDVCQELGLK